MHDTGTQHDASRPRPLPEYAVRRSRRARRVRLTVTPREGLVVTLPEGVPAAHAAHVVAQRAAWADRALAEVAERRRVFEAGPAAWLPDVVELRALGRTLPVNYAMPPAAMPPVAMPPAATAGTADNMRACARQVDGALHVSGAANAHCALGALRRWRNRTAADVLPAMVAELSERAGVSPSRITVRGQRTRWGSCSARGTVSLNRNLLFLPPHLVHYVLAHELVHLSILDHSPRFWQRLESLVPATFEMRAELRGARDLVPVWADD